MAEKNDNWFGSWLNAAKNKSTEVLEFVKKDLEEFGSIVKNEATNVVSNTGNAIGKTLKLDEPESTASTMKRSISSFLGQMNEVLSPSPDDSDTEAIMIIEGQEQVTLTKLQQAVYELQKNEATFTKDPEIALKKQYDCWLEIIDDQLMDERLTKHLHSSITLKNQYTRLVPVVVDHGLFWKRYLFKKALLEDDIARQEAMEKREAKEMKMTEENVQWEKEDFANGIELTEEEQIKLLEQYETETKEKNRKTSIPKTSPVIKEPVGEKILFQQETTPTKLSKGGKTKNRKIKTETNTIINDTVNEKGDIKKDDSSSDLSEKKSEIVIINKDSLNGLGAVNSSSSNSSTDGDWEKISSDSTSSDK